MKVEEYGICKCLQFHCIPSNAMVFFFSANSTTSITVFKSTWRGMLEELLTFKEIFVNIIHCIIHSLSINHKITPIIRRIIHNFKRYVLFRNTQLQTSSEKVSSCGNVGDRVSETALDPLEVKIREDRLCALRNSLAKNSSVWGSARRSTAEMMQGMDGR